ncbi:HopJ type III effector protein [Pseudomonas lijiangensis]|uniref:HopJ type III effector protein n=1 Tax=Pseudomonas lijiangensis TaxID=2995658 RepID=UPI0031BB29DB
MTDLNTLRTRLTSGEHVFADTLAFIAAGYDYQPQAFNNGGVENAAGQNEGSCKTLGLALLEGLSDEETMLAFGEHYRSVQATPEGTDHGNIRALIAHGLAGVKFEGEPLKRKG